MTYRARFHEWAWGDVGRRTVCGHHTATTLRNTVSDLGNVATDDRCGNCERMRGSIGTSSRPVPPEPTVANGASIEELAGALTARERHIAEHATGWRSRWPLYRNHFCAGPSHDDWSAIQGLIERGLMKIKVAPSELSGGDTVFCVTAIGIAALKQNQGRVPTGEASNETTG